MRRDITGRPGHIHILTTYGSVCAIAPHPQEQRAGGGPLGPGDGRFRPLSSNATLV